MAGGEGECGGCVVVLLVFLVLVFLVLVLLGRYMGHVGGDEGAI